LSLTHATHAELGAEMHQDPAIAVDGAAARTPEAQLPRGLVIGQAPPGPPESLPLGYQPLQGFPERRLAKLAGLRSPEELWELFDRVDLLGWCPGPKSRKEHHKVLDKHGVKKGYNKHRCDGHRFPLHLARLAAGRLLTFGGPLGCGDYALRDYAVVVLCGRLVAAAFGLKLRPSVPWAEESGGVRYLVMPHPSGVSHFWNDSMNRHRAAAAFRASLGVAGLSAPLPACKVPRPQSAGLTKASKHGKPAHQVPLKQEVTSTSSLREYKALVKTVNLAAAQVEALAVELPRIPTPPRNSRFSAQNPSEDVIHSRFFSNHCAQ